MSENKDMPTKNDKKVIARIKEILKEKKPPVDKELEKLLKDIDEVING